MKIRTLLVLVEILRLLNPLLIFNNPLIASIGSIILDDIDGVLFFRAGYKWRIYNRIDKLMDYWWYVFILLYSMKLSIFPIILFLFAYRTIGQIIILTTSKEKYFLYFPNIFERFFNFYIIFEVLGLVSLFSSMNFTIIILVLSLLVAFFFEWHTHIKRDPIIARTLFRTDINWAKNEK